MITRRGLLQGMGITAGAALGTRLAGSQIIGNANAAGQPATLVHIMFSGGVNAIFTGGANILSGKFESEGNAIHRLGTSDLYVDTGTMGQMPDFAKTHWAAIGCKHGNTSHLDRGAERALLFNLANGECNALRLASAMGGDSPLKAVHFGDRMPYNAKQAVQPVDGISLQRITDLGEAAKYLSTSTVVDPKVPNRALAAAGVSAAQGMSSYLIGQNPTSLQSAGDGYKAAVDTLNTPIPPSPPVTFDQIKAAYGMGGTVVDGKNFASIMGGTEVMIRAMRTNVISITYNTLVLWDFHQKRSNGTSLNGAYSRTKFNREVTTPLKTFLTRMLNLPDRNVVVVLTGDFVRLPNTDHGDGTLVAVMGKNIKPKLSYPCNGNAQFGGNTPGTMGMWSAFANAVGSPTNPFGADPHQIT